MGAPSDPKPTNRQEAQDAAQRLYTLSEELWRPLGALMQLGPYYPTLMYEEVREIAAEASKLGRRIGQLSEILQWGNLTDEEYSPE
jgi:hypothetical protein